ncbi:replication/maintenance protein [Nostoc sp. 'Peltigera membranacea cyanobiont' 213]|uniref:Crp/Fnr family transcriptional regulator n=1 Tax=unclassified Nostoc TaxID=2593658 RepID=UPI000B95BECD|nr:Crp/Fnr family transcriptional regulator [Nostoc sp. 'Peltigera membranacea cyanobiont' 213]OYD88140.1 replication/maintenance protein [Nostoc sp. 'Peltigera membranacea cyanobiont' 213]
MIYSPNVVYQSALEKSKTTRLFMRHEIIPTRNDILWRIEKGIVRNLTLTENGTLITLGYWSYGDLVGYPLSSVKPYQIQCLTNVETSVLPPQLWHQDIDAFVSPIQEVEKLLTIVHTKPISSRLWQFLLWLSKKFGRDVEQGKLIEFYTTHQQIAEVLNMSRVTVTRTLQQFEAEGILFRYKRRLILKL